MAIELGNKGARLLLVARRARELEAVRALCSGAGAMEVEVVVADLSTHRGVEHAIKSIIQIWDSLDVLILNHGVTSVKNFRNVTEHDLELYER